MLPRLYAIFSLSFSGLLKHYNSSHPDYHSTSMALVKMQSIIGKMSAKLRDTVRDNEKSILCLHIPQTGKYVSNRIALPLGLK